MNEKISFPDLVGLLSSKMNITKKEAETFLKEFFTVSTEVITSGEELRINGLGLFKPIWVEARGSINVQTGEPVEIPGHYKLSFIPDKVLREAVNAPFSSFSVEVLNDHVPIEDMTAVPSQDIDENNDICNTENVELQDSKEIREKEEEDEPIEPAHEYIQEDKSADEESSESTVSLQFQEEVIQPESETKVEEKEEDCYEDYLRKSASRKSFWWGVLSTFGIIIICLAGVLTAVISLFLLSRSGKKEGIRFAHNKWIYFMILAVVTGSVSGLYDKYLMTCLDRMNVQVWYNFYQLAIMGVILFTLWYPGRKKSTPFQWRNTIPFISILLVLADFAYFYALSYEDSMISIISLVRRSGVVVSFIAGAIWFKERNLKAKFIDLLLVLAGMYLIYLGTR